MLVVFLNNLIPAYYLYDMNINNENLYLFIFVYKQIL